MSRKSQLADLMSAAVSTAGADIGSSKSNGDDENRIQNIELDKIYVNPSQHRKYFDADEQEKLKNSIAQNGFKGAILLRILEGDAVVNGYEYELVYGESRHRAVQNLGWKTIPAVVENLTEREVHRIRLDENLVRKDLNPLEETNGILEVAADELEATPEQVLSLLDEVENATRRKIPLKGDVALQSEKLQAVLDYYKKGSLSGFRTKYRKLQKLPNDIRDAVQKSLDWSKAVEIQPIKDSEERKKVLEWAIKNNPSIKEIRRKRKDLALKNVNDDGLKLLSSSESLKKKFYEGLAGVSDSHIWDDPENQQRLQHLIAEFESVFDIEII